MAETSLQQGRIVWATVPDQRGVNPKKRPLILLMDEANVPEGEPLPFVVVSHTFPSPLPSDHVLLPYSNDRSRPAVTKLTTKSAAVGSWVVLIPRDQIAPEDIGGLTPPARMAAILLIVDPPPGDDSPSGSATS